MYLMLYWFVMLLKVVFWKGSVFMLMLFLKVICCVLLLVFYLGCWIDVCKIDVGDVVFNKSGVKKMW